MNPNLTQNEQIKRMKEKLTTSIKKVMTIEMITYQTHVYFNMCMLRSVYFRYGIVDLVIK